MTNSTEHVTAQAWRIDRKGTPKSKWLPGSNGGIRNAPVVMAGLFLLAVVVAPLSPQVAPGSSPRLTLGVLDGPEELSFGHITDVALDSLGNIFVVDRQYQSVPWFDSTGHFHRDLGRTGQGPGEFRGPEAVALDGENRIHVADPGNARVSVFAVAGESLRHINDQRVPEHQITDLCFIGNRRFAVSRGSRVEVIELDEDGGVLRVLEPRMVLEGPLSRKIGSVPATVLFFGPVACDPTHGMVYYASQFLGTVLAYSVHGGLRWSVTLPDYNLSDISLAPSGGCCAFLLNAETDSYDQVVGAAVDEEGRLYITLYEFGVTGQSPEDFFQRYEVRVLRPSDGKQLSQEPTDYVVTGFEEGRPYGYRNFPVIPQVVVF